MKNLNDVRGEDFEVIISDWEENIRTAFKHNVFVFHSSIWNMSLTAFDKPREIQVVIDGNDKLFISVGNPGFVSFGGQNEQTHGMKFPLKEWIHTHPFGQAYFSQTDMTTISMYERFLSSATVLGMGEKQTIYFRVFEDKNYQEYTQFVWLDEKGEEE
tara:strand:- start:321 stop:794 length:474 start_codon:yes stop_codon:yes gene_type:complete